MKLASYIKQQNLTYREFAELCGFDAAQVNRWATGKRLPTLDVVARIKVVTNGQVTADDFMEAIQVTASRAESRGEAA
ncbi:MAG: helix-turn-helix domain-containing protein [Acetobacteraceae bacterium]